MLPIIELTINNKPLDLGEAKINLKYFIYDPEEIEMRGSTVSYTFKLPASKYNLGILGVKTSDWQTVNNYKLIKDVNLVVNSDTLVVGYLELESFEGAFISANFKSDQWNWSKELSNKSLQDLVKYRAPFSYVNSTNVDELTGSLHSYYDSYDTERKLNFPLVARGYFYKPKNTRIYLLNAATGVRELTDLPDGTYEVNQNARQIKVLGGYIENLHNYPEGYYKVVKLPSMLGDPTYDVEFYTKPITGNTETLMFQFEDIPPSFYVYSILKKILLDINIRGSCNLLETHHLLKRLMMTYSGEFFKWNWERLGLFYAEGPRYKLLESKQLGGFVIPLTFFDWGALTSDEGVVSITGVITFNNPDLRFIANPVRTLYYILPVDSTVTQDLGSNYVSRYISTEFYNRYGYFYRVPEKGKYRVKVKLEYTLDGNPFGPNENQSSTANVLALLKGALTGNSDNGISLASATNSSLSYPVIGGTTEGFGSNSCLYWKSMQIPDSGLPFPGPFVEFEVDIDLERNEEIFPCFISSTVADGTSRNIMYRCVNTIFSVKPLESDWDIDIAKNLPDVTQLDFVKDIMFLLNLFPRYDFVQRKLDFLTYEECLELPFIDLNNRSSIIEAEQKGINKSDYINLGYEKEEANLLVKDWKDYNLYVSPGDIKSVNNKKEYLTQFVARTNMRDVSVLMSTTTNSVRDAAVLAVLDDETTKKPYWDIDWKTDWKQSLGILNLNKFEQFVIEDTAITPFAFSAGYSGCRDGGTYVPTVYDTSPLPDYLFALEPNPTYSVGMHYKFLFKGDDIPLSGVLHSHPILNFNELYKHFYQNLLEKHNSGYKVVIKTSLKYNEFKEAIKGGIRKVKWNNDYFLLLEIDKYDISTEIGELTLIKALGY